MSDIYSDVAKKYQVSRMAVKQLAIPIIYGFGAPTGSKMVKAIEQTVETALRLGIIQREKKS